MTMPEALTSPSAGDDLALRLATAACLDRFSGASRRHTESDLRLFFAWCADQHLAPLAAERARIECYVRWMQEVRRSRGPTWTAVFWLVPRVVIAQRPSPGGRVSSGWTDQVHHRAPRPRSADLRAIR